jgi:hypothetical protein
LTPKSPWARTTPFNRTSNKRINISLTTFIQNTSYIIRPIFHQIDVGTAQKLGGPIAIRTGNKINNLRNKNDPDHKTDKKFFHNQTSLLS